MTTPDVSPALITAVEHLDGAKYYALASFVMLVYDTILTLPREVDKIWCKRRFSGLTVLWVCNRWVFLLMVIPTIASMHDPAFTGKVCERYFRYPGYVQAFQRTVIGSVFILRTYCLYNRSLKIAALIAVFLGAEIFVKLYTTIMWGQPVQPPPGIVACILTVSQENSGRFIIFFFMELIVDTLVLVLTVIRSIQTRVIGSSRFRGRGGASAGGELLRLILKDGVVYFVVMCSANLITVLMYLTASEDLKASNADFAVMANSLLVARLILNLKSVGSKAAAFETGQSMEWRVAPRAVAPQAGQTKPGRWEALVLGDIGNELEGESTKGSGSMSSMEDAISLNPTTRASATLHDPTSRAGLLRASQIRANSGLLEVPREATESFTLPEDGKDADVRTDAHHHLSELSSIKFVDANAVADVDTAYAYEDVSSSDGFVLGSIPRT